MHQVRCRAMYQEALCLGALQPPSSNWSAVPSLMTNLALRALHQNQQIVDAKHSGRHAPWQAMRQKACLMPFGRLCRTSDAPRSMRSNAQSTSMPWRDAATKLDAESRTKFDLTGSRVPSLLPSDVPSVIVPSELLVLCLIVVLLD